MIRKVRIKNFKMFDEQVFDLTDRIVLAGPNNSGKSTLLQAISTWQSCFQRWLDEQSSRPSSPQKQGGKTVPGQAVTRKDFTALPLREMNLLWNNRHTNLSKGELVPETKAGDRNLIDIALEGILALVPWDITVRLAYQSKEQVYYYVSDASGQPLNNLPQHLEKLNIVHIPPFSGIGAEETRYDLGYQNLLVGQGKPGDILRNLLLEIYQHVDGNHWKNLVLLVEELFDCTLIDPKYSARSPYILCEYKPKQRKGRATSFDVASGGSGFHQVLMLLGFIFARPSTVILMDEPDAHLHVILQRQIYDKLRELARQRDSQIIIATHSEVFLEDTAPENIYSFFGLPHKLQVETERDQVREALKRLSTFDLLSADYRSGVIYLEDEGDLKILREFASIINHRLLPFLKEPYFVPLKGRNPREGKAHFFALKSVRPDIRGAILLDGDNRILPDHEVVAENLVLMRWKRYEIENYLLIPIALARFARGSVPPGDIFDKYDKAISFLKDEIPKAAFSDPLGDHEFLNAIPASKSLLPKLFWQIGLDMTKSEYYLIARMFTPEEIHPEVREKLDSICDAIFPDNERLNE